MRLADGLGHPSSPSKNSPQSWFPTNKLFRRYYSKLYYKSQLVNKNSFGKVSSTLKRLYFHIFGVSSDDIVIVKIVYTNIRWKNMQKLQYFKQKDCLLENRR